MLKYGIRLRLFTKCGKQLLHRCPLTNSDRDEDTSREEFRTSILEEGYHSLARSSPVYRAASADDNPLHPCWGMDPDASEGHLYISIV